MIRAKAEVYNLLGQKIKAFELLELETTERLDKGFYIIVVENEGKKTTQKIAIICAQPIQSRQPSQCTGVTQMTLAAA